MRRVVNNNLLDITKTKKKNANKEITKITKQKKNVRRGNYYIFFFFRKVIVYTVTLLKKSTKIKTMVIGSPKRIKSKK